MQTCLTCLTYLKPNLNKPKHFPITQTKPTDQRKFGVVRDGREDELNLNTGTRGEGELLGGHETPLTSATAGIHFEGHRLAYGAVWLAIILLLFFLDFFECGLQAGFRCVLTFILTFYII